MKDSKFKSILKKKEVQEGKEDSFEKNDFLALILAAVSVFFPILLLFCIGLAIFIYLFVVLFS